MGASLVGLEPGAGGGRQGERVARQPHDGWSADACLGATLGSVGVERELGRRAPVGGHGDHVEGRRRARVERLGDGGVERLLVRHVLAVEADDDERLAVVEVARRRRAVAARGQARDRRRGEGAGRERRAEHLAVLDRQRERGEITPLVVHIGGLARDRVVDLVEQAVDQHDRAVDLVLDAGELAVILLDRARKPVGGVDRFDQVGGHRRLRGDVVGERVERRDICENAVEFALRRVPLGDQDRVARRGADLQARADRGDDRVIALGVLLGDRAELLEAGVGAADRRFQRFELAVELHHLGADEGAGRADRLRARCPPGCPLGCRCARRGSGGCGRPRAPSGGGGRRKRRRGLALDRRRLYDDLLRRLGRGLVAGKRRPEVVGDHRAAPKEKHRSENGNARLVASHAQDLPSCQHHSAATDTKCLSTAPGRRKITTRTGWMSRISLRLFSNCYSAPPPGLRVYSTG